MSRNGVLVLLGIAALAVSLRVAAVELAPKILPYGDELNYIRTAVSLAEGRGHVDTGFGGPERHSVARAAWPPGHPFVLSRFLEPGLARDSPYTVAVLTRLIESQLLLGTLLVLLTAWLGFELFGGRVALVAGGLAAIYPTWVAYSHYLWSENLFGVLLTGGLIALVRGARRASTGLLVLTGLIFGLATLTEEIGLPLAGVCGIWWVLFARGAPRRKRMAQAGLLLAVSVAVVLPWSVRNYRQLGRIVPVATNGWMALREGNTFSAGNWLYFDWSELGWFRATYFGMEDEGERMDFAREQALALIRAEQPAWIFKKLVRNTAQLLSPDSQIFTKLDLGAYGAVPLPVVRLLIVITVLSYVGLFTAGVLGVAATRDPALRVLPLLLTGAVLAIHVVAQSHARYRVPLMGLFMVYGAHAILSGRKELLRSGPWTRLAVALVLAVFFALCVPYALPWKLWLHGVAAG